MDHSKFWLWNPPNVNWSGMSLIFYALNIRKLAINPETKIHNQKDRHPEISNTSEKISCSKRHPHPQAMDFLSILGAPPSTWIFAAVTGSSQVSIRRYNLDFTEIQASNGWFQWDFTIENGDYIYLMGFITHIEDGDLLVILYILWYWFYGIHELKHIENGDLMGLITHIENGDLMGFSAGWNVEVGGWNGITKWDNYWDWFQASMVGYN